MATLWQTREAEYKQSLEIAVDQIYTNWRFLLIIQSTWYSYSKKQKHYGEKKFKPHTEYQYLKFNLLCTFSGFSFTL